MNQFKPALLAVFLLFADPATAQACLAGPELHELDPVEMAEDSSPPGAIPKVLAEIRRGRAPDSAGCGEVSMVSTDDLGWVTLTVTPPTDDRTPDDKMGYMVTLVDGTVPDGLTMPAEPWRATGGTLTLSWVDGATDNHDSFSFTLAITSLDLAGNEGPAFQLSVSDRDDGTGCHTNSTPGRFLPSLVLFLFIQLTFVMVRRFFGSAEK